LFSLVLEVLLFWALSFFFAQLREMGMKEAINSLFHHDTLHSTSNKPLENATRTNQLLTGHNLRIQLQDMLHGF
jgi:hypothetical protein